MPTYCAHARCIYWHTILLCLCKSLCIAIPTRHARIPTRHAGIPTSCSQTMKVVLTPLCLVAHTVHVRAQGIFSQSGQIRPKSDCLYHFLWLVWNRTEFLLMPNQSEKCSYNLQRKFGLILAESENISLRALLCKSLSTFMSLLQPWKISRYSTISREREVPAL